MTALYESIPAVFHRNFVVLSVETIEKNRVGVGMKEDFARALESIDNITKNLAVLESNPEDIETYNSISSRLDVVRRSIDRGYRNARSIRPIFIVAMPSSASVYIKSELARRLRYPLREPHITRPSHVVISETIIEDLCDGGGISRIHLDPLPININILNESPLDRFVVTVRDPRASILSLAHWEPGPVRPLINEPLSTRIDFLIQTELPKLVSFLTGWVETYAQPNWSCKILFTRFEDLKTDYRAFFNSILDFYEIDHREFLGEEHICEPGEECFRKGSIDEWKSVLSPEQISVATRQIPEALLDLFKWPKSV